jgi:hypothetical protein
MPHPFDATLKDILGHHAADLAPLLHLPMHLPCRPLNADLSTITAATDLAFGFGEPLEEVVDINFQSGPDAHLPGRLLLYNVAYHHHQGVPVRTILFLLRPAADHPHLTGRLAYQAGQCTVEFQYETVRLWQQPLEPFLHGGLGLLPLAPLCQLPADVPPEQALKAVVHQIDDRLVSDVAHAQAMQLMTATFILTGMRVGPESMAQIFQGVRTMHESSAFTLYEEKGRQEGRLQESHRLLLRLGTKQFGRPDPATEAALRAIGDLDRLERLADAVLTVHSWQDFLNTP